MFAVVVLAAIFFMLKKFAAKRNENKASINLNVISKISLQPKNHLFVVKVGDKILVLGVSENNINILTELEPNFADNMQNKSQETIKNEVISKLAATNMPQTADLSFLNFIKSSFKFNN